MLYKEPNQFRYAPDLMLQAPLIMIGPGTGVAPFLGFLQHIRFLMRKWRKIFFRLQNKKYMYKFQTTIARFVHKSELNRKVDVLWLQTLRHRFHLQV